MLATSAARLVRPAAQARLVPRRVRRARPAPRAQLAPRVATLASRDRRVLSARKVPRVQPGRLVPAQLVPRARSAQPDRALAKPARPAQPARVSPARLARASL